MKGIQKIKSLHAVIATSVLLAACLLSARADAIAAPTITSEVIALTNWPGGVLPLHINRPSELKKDLPVVVVIPGARRNADEYSQYWLPLVSRLPFITVTIECTLQLCPTEHHYNLGGYKLEDGSSPAANQQFYSTPELAFALVKQKYQLTTQGFYLFGHSAGGTFAHLYNLIRPDAPVLGVVAANPAFFMLPDPHITYPFGLKSSGFTSSEVSNWLAKPTVIMLGDRDLNPRTKLLSNSPVAQQQGLAVFSRGLNFFSRITDLSLAAGKQPGWQLVVAAGVGHDAGQMAPYAFQHWFGEQEAAK